VHHIALLFTICVSLSGQQTARDVYGWNGTRWGMTLVQVKAAVNYSIEPEPETKNEFRVTQSIKIDEIPVKVGFQFVSDKLTIVSLAVDKGENRSVAFDSLKRSLIEKFGKPSDENTKLDHPIPGAFLRTVFWSFPSTSITLEWHEFSETSGLIYVNYLPRNKKTAL
jgi:hypothetical protein